MQLNRAGREYYTLELAATDISGQPITGTLSYEASFDGGATWSAGAQDATTGWWQWLVAGPAAPAPPAGVTLAATITTAWVNPIVRLVDNPEIVASDMPTITLVA